MPVDGAGLDVAALAAAGPETVLVTPAHQYPTGVVLAPVRRRALLDWARSGRLVIEDDYDAEHRYDRAPVAALAALAPERRACGQRVEDPRARAAAAGVSRRRPCATSSWCASSGRTSPARPSGSSPWPSSSRRAPSSSICGGCGRASVRRDALLAALRAPAGGRVGVAAGLHLLVGLPEGIDDGMVARAALAGGVAVQPLSYHRLRAGPPGLVVGYAAVTPSRLHEAVDVLVNAVRMAAEQAGLTPQLPQRR